MIPEKSNELKLQIVDNIRNSLIDLLSTFISLSSFHTVKIGQVDQLLTDRILFSSYSKSFKILDWKIKKLVVEEYHSLSEVINPEYGDSTLCLILPLYGEHLNTYWCYRFFIICGLIDSLETIEFLTTADIDLDKIHKLFRKYIKNLILKQVFIKNK